MIENAIRMEKAYGLTSEAAAGLVENMARANRSATEFMESVGKKSQKEFVSTSLVMRDLASQGQKIAMYGERATEAMTNMAISGR